MKKSTNQKVQEDTTQVRVNKNKISIRAESVAKFAAKKSSMM